MIGLIMTRLKGALGVFILALSLVIFAACKDSPSGGDDGLPPDPGEPGKRTLAGIDSDGDGLRDDVQRYIYMEYEDPQTREALVNIAKVDLQSLLQANDPESSIQAFEYAMRASECLFYIMPDDAFEASQRLRAQILNTTERSAAYMRSSSHAGGLSFESQDPNQWQDSCNL